MSFKKLVVAVLAGVVLAVGVATAEAKSRVSSKPSFSRSVSKPSYSAPRVVTKQTPVYRSAPSRTTVIQKNYYNSPNRGYSGGSYGGGFGGGGMGSSIVGGAVGAAGGMLLMDALTEDEGEKALKLQQEQIRIEEAKAQQERDDKQDQILENQKEEELREEVSNEPFFKLNPELIPAK
jgi:hypothetical protein